MPTLTIQSEDGKELLKLQIAPVDPREATIAVLNALAALKKPKKTRSDAGVKRGQKTEATPELQQTNP